MPLLREEVVTLVPQRIGRVLDKPSAGSPGAGGTQRSHLSCGEGPETLEDFSMRRMWWLATIPAGRFGTPEELGTAIAFLCTPAAAYINGINLPVDGGRLPTL